MVETLVLGWDGATKKHLDRFNLDTYSQLDNKGKLLPEEVYQGIPIDSGTAWTSITTGLPVEKHGIYSINNISSNKSFLKLNKSISKKINNLQLRTWIYYGLNKLFKKERSPKSTDVPYKRVWEYFEDQGYHSLSLGVPLTYPAWKQNSVMISGIPAPLNNPKYYDAYPKKYSKFKKEYRGFYYIENGKTPLQGKERPNLEEYKENVFDLNEKAAEVIKKLDKKENFDFIFAVLPLIDDFLHAEDDIKEIKRAYEKIDEITRHLIDKLDPKNLLLISDHGMKPIKERLKPLKQPGLKMIHDSEQGIYATNMDIELNTHLDVTPSLLNSIGQEFEPEKQEINYFKRKSQGEKIEELQV